MATAPCPATVLSPLAPSHLPLCKPRNRTAQAVPAGEHGVVRVPAAPRSRPRLALVRQPPPRRTAAGTATLAVAAPVIATPTTEGATGGAPRHPQRIEAPATAAGARPASLARHATWRVPLLPAPRLVAHLALGRPNHAVVCVATGLGDGASHEAGVGTAVGVVLGVAAQAVQRVPDSAMAAGAPPAAMRTAPTSSHCRLRWWTRRCIASSQGCWPTRYHLGPTVMLAPLPRPQRVAHHTRRRRRHRCHDHGRQRSPRRKMSVRTR